MVQAPTSTQKDFFCIEITPHFSNGEDNYFAFDIGITTKSRIEPNSLIAISPEFKDFMAHHEAGKAVKELITSERARVVPIGRVAGVTNGRVIKYHSFYPFYYTINPTFSPFNGLKEFRFAELLKGKGISSLIEANILKCLKKKYPRAELHYTNMTITSIRRKQLEKIRHKDPYEPGFVEDEYNIFKRFLKKQRNRKLAKK